MTSERTVGRLSLYRRLLTEIMAEGVSSIYSHDLAARTGCTAAQVRRDLMVTGYTGSPTRGYDVKELVSSIGKFLDSDGGMRVGLVGVGNLGRALLAYFSVRRPSLKIVAAFDHDERKTDRVIHGCRCYRLDEMGAVLHEERIRVAVLAVPAAHAQAVADQLISYGVYGLLNFAPTPLRAPEHVFIEHIDMTMALEKVAFYARHETKQKEPAK